MSKYEREIDWGNIPDKKTKSFKPPEVDWGNIPEPSLLNKVGKNLMEGTLGAGDALRDLLSLGYANPNPTNTHSTAYDVGHLIGNVGSFLGAGSALKGINAVKNLTGVPASIGRVLGSSGFEAAQNKDDRLGGAVKGAEAGAIGEALGLPFRLLGLAAEKNNPIKFAGSLQRKIFDEAQKKKQEMSNLYNSVLSKVGDTKISSFENKKNIIDALKNAGAAKGRFKIKDNPLGFSEEERRYFTPDIKKAYENFSSNPTFNELHDFQSLLGKESSKLSGVPSKIKTYQNLKSARDKLHDTIIPTILGPNTNVYKTYQQARTIGREEYFPYESNKNIKQVAQGKRNDLSPQNLFESIMDIHMKRPEGNPLDISHPLSTMRNQLEKKMQTSQLMQGLSPFAGASLGIMGGPVGSALGFMGAPRLLQAAQNPMISKIGNRGLSPFIRALLASPEISNEMLE